MEIIRPTSRNARQYHNLGGTPTYATWYGMIDRCINPSNISYKYYGGRGISVCEEWLNIAKFVEDMGIRPDGMTLDRIDRNGNYCLSNCKWSDVLEQQRNKSNVRLNKNLADQMRKMHIDGVKQKKIADIFGVDCGRVSMIISGKMWR